MRGRAGGLVAAIVAAVLILAAGALLLARESEDNEPTGAVASPARATPEPAVANGWIVAGAADGARCGTPVTYEASAACRFSSINAFYQVAQCGDRALIRAGRYEEQEIFHNDNKNGCRERVVFEAEPGADVKTGELKLNTSGDADGEAGTSAAGPEHLEFRDFDAATIVLRNVADAVFSGITMRLYFIRSSSDITVESSDRRACEIGPQENFAPEIGSNGPASTRPAERITFDGCLFHDMTKNAPGCEGAECPHVDCMTVGDVDGLVVRNSVFRKCWHISLILADDLNGKAARNYLIENNRIGAPVEPGGSLMIGSTDGPGVIRFNEVGSSLAWTGGEVAPGMRVQDNEFGANPSTEEPCTMGGANPDYTGNTWPEPSITCEKR